MKAGTSGYQAKQTINNKRYENWLRIGKGSYYKHNNRNNVFDSMKKLQLKTGQTMGYLSENPKLKIMTPLGYTNSLTIKN